VQLRVLAADYQLENTLIQLPLKELLSLGFLVCDSACQDTTESMLLINHQDTHLPKCKVVAFSKNCDLNRCSEARVCCCWLITLFARLQRACSGMFLEHTILVRVVYECALWNEKFLIY